MPSAWNMFVKKIYEEGKAKDPSYEFKQALMDASKRKSEMGNSAASGVRKSLKKKSKKINKRSISMSASLAGGKKTRRRHRHRRR